MNSHRNRAEELWHNWATKEKQLQELPGLGGEGALVIKQQKYDFLRHGLYRLSVNPSEKEVLFAHVIRSVTDKLRKQLYPNPVMRLLHRLKEAVYDKPLHLRRFQQQRAENLDQLKGQLKTAGFASIDGKLEKHLDYETSKVDIHLTRQLNSQNRLDVTLLMERDRVGRYQFSKYEASLSKKGEDARSYVFRADSRITAMEAANLLDGRAVKKSFETADGTSNKAWIQFDFANRNTEGSPKLREFHQDYGYDPQKELLKLSMETGVAGLAEDKIIQNLEGGNILTFHIRDKGPYYLSANPMEKNLHLYDKNKRPLEMTELLQELRQPNVAQVKTISLVKNQEREQNQSLGLG
ncbi:hypothetical protein SNE26_17490 [Mucilaginibacter sp. cycad4]|uniref:hypothetical protein n=1 Tax=Mucilaginibacter sp. cycad4 TaxID=3342096 RepID=UPI002AAAB36B|nr:hypothetical protein [Mucilaginibacter gossypii]WPU97824.1 hypothetical protein SNE26_17490 [Mucilaginibacter gossypii]